MALSEKLRKVILEKARRLLKQQIEWRRHLHQHPELSHLEFETTAYLKKVVSRIGLKTIPIAMPSGLLTEIQGPRPGNTMALRSDIDALPVTERTVVPYKSKIEGRMHACGHDVHMAILLGVASLLNELRGEIAGRVRFIFQPAEEMPPGGARPMIEAGAIKDVSMIFALHVDPLLPTGRISLRDGVAMGSVTDFDLTISGKGGHAARPHEAVDAIVTAAEVIGSIQTVVSREIDPIHPVVVTFGKIEGGTARNTICDQVKVTGTARALSPVAARGLKRLIKRTATSIGRARGATVEMELVADYPVLANDPSANRILADNYAALFSKRHIETTEQVLGGEDFACYLQKTKGAMFRLGVRNKKIKADKPWHSPEFKVDEEAIYYGTALMVASALDYLGGRDK